jgi:hypothetical protein
VGIKGNGVTTGDYIHIEDYFISAEEAAAEDEEGGDGAVDLSDFGLWTTWLFFGIMLLLLCCCIWCCYKCCK